jgi:hypothetical protein
MHASHRAAPTTPSLLVASAPGRFELEELIGLPEPVARYFRRAIAVGAPLASSATLAMRGRLKLNGRWLAMRATEVLAPHRGLVWRARVGGLIVGSDRGEAGQGVMDWRLLGLVRVTHAEGPDIARSAAGRAAGEAVWVPTALLPRFGVTWEALDDTHLTARFTVGAVESTLHLTTTLDGEVESVSMDRWGDPSGTGTWGSHPFGFVATETRRFGPLTIPAAGSAGWFPGTERWPDGEFFRCTITELTPT